MINRLNLVFWLTLGAWIALIFTLLGSALPNDGAARKIKQALADLVESNAGAIWLQDDQNHYQLKAAINMSFDRHTLIDPNDDLVRHFRDKEWIIGLNVYKADPVAYMRRQTGLHQTPLPGAVTWSVLSYL